MIVDKFQCNVSLLFYSQDKEQGVVLKKAMTLFYSAGIKQISDGDSTWLNPFKETPFGCTPILLYKVRLHFPCVFRNRHWESELRPHPVIEGGSIQNPLQRNYKWRPVILFVLIPSLFEFILWIIQQPIDLQQDEDYTYNANHKIFQRDLYFRKIPFDDNFWEESINIIRIYTLWGVYSPVCNRGGIMSIESKQGKQPNYLSDLLWLVRHVSGSHDPWLNCINKIIPLFMSTNNKASKDAVLTMYYLYLK